MIENALTFNRTTLAFVDRLVAGAAARATVTA
jgi:hypothetical protein